MTDQTTQFEAANSPFPYLVIRLMATVYQREAIKLRRGRQSALIAHRQCHLIHPGVSPTGCVSEAAEVYFELTALAFSMRQRFRVCVVWTPNRCRYVEPDGTISLSDRRPAGGFIEIPTRKSTAK